MDEHKMRRTAIFGLLDLPAEIRLRNYQLLIPICCKFRLRRHADTWILQTSKHQVEDGVRPSSAVLRVCSPCYQEALRPLYLQNTFSFNTLDRAVIWLEVTSRDKAASIRNLHFSCCRDLYHLTHIADGRLTSMMPQLTGFRSLEIETLANVGQRGWCLEDRDSLALWVSQTMASRLPHLKKTL